MRQKTRRRKAPRRASAKKASAVIPGDQAVEALYSGAPNEQTELHDQGLDDGLGGCLLEEAISLMEAAEGRRAVFLGEIEDFINTANSEELRAIRRALQAREERCRRLEPGSQFDAEWLDDLKANARGVSIPQAPKNNKKGRRRAYTYWTDWDWIKNAGRVAWEHHVLGWPWKKIAEHAELSVSEANWKTTEQKLRRLRDQYAALVWSAIPLGERGPSGLRKDALDNRTVQYSLECKAGLPFDSHPEECKKLILELALIGQEEHARILVRRDWVAFTIVCAAENCRHPDRKISSEHDLVTLVGKTYHRGCEPSPKHQA